MCLHSMHSYVTRKLIYSPDTDIYHIGLTQMMLMPPEVEVIVQLSKSHEEKGRFMHMNNLPHSS